MNFDCYVWFRLSRSWPQINQLTKKIMITAFFKNINIFFLDPSFANLLIQVTLANPLEKRLKKCVKIKISDKKLKRLHSINQIF